MDGNQCRGYHPLSPLFTPRPTISDLVDEAQRNERDVIADRTVFDGHGGQIVLRRKKIKQTRQKQKRRHARDEKLVYSLIYSKVMFCKVRVRSVCYKTNRTVWYGNQNYRVFV